MPDDAGATRVALNAAATRIPLDPAAPARIANAARATAQRFAEGNIALPLEAEPSTYAVVARGNAAT